MRTLPWPVRSYLAVIFLGAAGIVSWQLVNDGVPGSERLPLAGLLALCVMLAWLFPLPISFKTHFYLDTAVVMAAVLLFEPGFAMLITGGGALAAQLVRRRSWDEAVFNTSQTMLQAALAAWFLQVSGYDAGAVAASDPGFVVSVVMTGIILFLASAVLVGTIVSLQGGLNPVSIWLESIIKADDAVYLGHLAQVGLGIVIAVLGDTHPWTIVLLIPSVMVAYLALRHGMELRRQISLALRLQEKNLTEAQRLAHVGSWEWDLTSGAQGWSEEAFRILGYEPPFPTPTIELLIDRVHPDDQQLLDGRIHAAIRYQSSFDVEHRVLGPDGKERMVHHRGEIISDKDGRMRIVAMIHDVSEQKSLEAQLEHMAFHDPLTGLLNRSQLIHEIDSTLDGWRHGGKPFALFFVDLDGFKEINDRLGHKAGDDVLTDVARRLESTVREADIVARYGGDEFVILARSVTKESEAGRLACRILKSAQSVSVAGAGYKVTGSVGVVIPDSRLVTTDELLQHVDAALYTAKHNGKNGYAMFDAGQLRGPISETSR